MIVDRIENAQQYNCLSENIAKALEILKNTDFAGKEDGRYDIDGDELFYIVQRYETKPVSDGKFEAHQKYIDIQFVVQGAELLGYAPLSQLEVKTAYDQAGDCALYKIPAEFTSVNLQAGVFCILYPQDGHMPGRELNGPQKVHKIVVKVKINA